MLLIAYDDLPHQVQLIRPQARDGAARSPQRSPRCDFLALRMASRNAAAASAAAGAAASATSARYKQLLPTGKLLFEGLEVIRAVASVEDSKGDDIKMCGTLVQLLPVDAGNLVGGI